MDDVGYELCKAAMTGNLAQVKKLVNEGVDPNYQDPRAKYSVLHCACGNGYDEVAEFLIERGVNVDVQNSTGRTPLHFAARIGNKPCSRLLVAAGCDVNLLDIHGKSALHISSRLGHFNLSHYLIKSKASSQQKDSDGHIPLDLAIDFLKKFYN